MVLLESSGAKKRNALDDKLVLNKILTFPPDQFWVKKHGCSGGREGAVGKGPPAIYIKGNSLSRKQLKTVAEFLCMVSIFCIVLPKFIIAMTIIL